MSAYQLMPPLTADQYETLKADIAANGVLVPVERDEQGNILDGHNRQRVCDELGIVPPTVVREGLTEEQKHEHALRVNLRRRHLTQAQKRDLVRRELERDPDRSDREIARLIGVSHPTVAAVRRELEDQMVNLSTGDDGDDSRPSRSARPLSAERICRALPDLDDTGLARVAEALSAEADRREHATPPASDEDPPWKGRSRAVRHSSPKLSKVMGEYYQLKGRAARAVFADEWLGIWAEQFDHAWPVVYELLSIVKDDELYKDPRRVGPDAPGDRESHGDRVYETFESYFYHRIRPALEKWAELEEKHRYIYQYAPRVMKALTQNVACDTCPHCQKEELLSLLFCRVDDDVTGTGSPPGAVANIARRVAEIGIDGCCEDPDDVRGEIAEMIVDAGMPAEGADVIARAAVAEATGSAAPVPPERGESS